MPETFLSSSDAGWLHMEEPCNLMMIAALLEFDGPLPQDRLEQVVRQRLLSHDRFRMRVDESGARPRWVEADVDLGYHLQRVRLSSDEQLMPRVDDLLGQALRRDRPLWQFHIFEFAGRTALVPRLHHAMGDGVALMRLLMNLTDAPESEAPRPERAPGQAPAWYRAVARLLGLLFSRPDPPSALKRPLGPEKRAAHSRCFSLSELKQKARNLNLTLNDLLMASLSDALRSYLLERRCPVPSSGFRAVMPVDLRSHGDAELGNRFGLVFLTLPVVLAEADQRHRAVKDSLDELKRSSEAVATYALIRLAGMLPVQVEHWLVRFFGTKATLVATNLPGPRQRCSLAGSPLERIVYWVPMSGRLGLGVSFLSYADQLQMGVVSDAAAVPDPQRIVALFEEVL